MGNEKPIAGNRAALSGKLRFLCGIMGYSLWVASTSIEYLFIFPAVMDILNDQSEEIDDLQEDKVSQKSSSKRKKKHVKMMCFSCNRPEVHTLVVRKRWFFSYLLGLTFGLSLILGPFFCVCCGTTRWMCHNYLNPRYWFRMRRNKKLSGRNR